MTALNSYLSFNGNCEEAFTFYRSVLGGEFSQKKRFKDMPFEHPVPAKEGEKIMHIELQLGPDTLLMGCDVPSTMGAVNFGNNFHISIDTQSEKEAGKLFNGLSAGGKVTMPLDKTFWGALFGMFTDKFGIQWMINYDYNKNK